MGIKKIILGTVAYILAAFTIQPLNHFVVSKEHYAGIAHLRSEPIIPLGLLVTVAQGFVLSALFCRYFKEGSSIAQGIKFSLMMGLFLGSYIALGEAAKYSVPSIPAWIATEATASLIQFLLFGILLGLIHRGHSKGANSR